MDFPSDSILMSHMGEGNWRLARADRPVRLIKRSARHRRPRRPADVPVPVPPGPGDARDPRAARRRALPAARRRGRAARRRGAAGARDALRAVPPGRRRARVHGRVAAARRAASPDPQPGPPRRAPGASSASWPVSSSSQPDPSPKGGAVMRRSSVSNRFGRLALCALLAALVPAVLLGTAAASKPARTAHPSPGGHDGRGGTATTARASSAGTARCRSRSRASASSTTARRSTATRCRTGTWRSRSSPTAGSSRSCGRPTGAAGGRT